MVPSSRFTLEDPPAKGNSGQRLDSVEANDLDLLELVLKLAVCVCVCLHLLSKWWYAVHLPQSTADVNSRAQIAGVPNV